LYDFTEIAENGVAARAAFEFELRDSKTGTAVWSHYYSHNELVGGKAVAAVVAAVNRNVRSGLNEVMGGLEQYFSAQAQTTAPAQESPLSFTYVKIRFGSRSYS
jgi:hypothetical protein